MDISKIFLISFPIFLILSFNLITAYLPLDLYTVPNTDNKHVIKILIYNGEGTMDSSVEGLERSLNEINYQNTSSYYFNYSTTSLINSKTLSGYDIVIIPGGNAHIYIKSDYIDVDSVKQFIQEGNGYIGICAGSYVASNTVNGYYSAWGLTDVNSTVIDYEGSLSLSFTSFGSKALNESEIENIHMENGPAMYSNNFEVIMANYADNSTGCQNYAAIVGDTYGSGRVLLSSPHPELEPQNLQLLEYMMLWTSKKI